MWGPCAVRKQEWFQSICCVRGSNAVKSISIFALIKWPQRFSKPRRLRLDGSFTFSSFATQNKEQYELSSQNGCGDETGIPCSTERLAIGDKVAAMVWGCAKDIYQCKFACQMMPNDAKWCHELWFPVKSLKPSATSARQPIIPFEMKMDNIQ